MKTKNTHKNFVLTVSNLFSDDRNSFLEWIHYEKCEDESDAVEAWDKKQKYIWSESSWVTFEIEVVNCVLMIHVLSSDIVMVFS